MLPILMFPDVSQICINLIHALLYRMVHDIVSLQSFLICSTPLLFSSLLVLI